MNNLSFKYLLSSHKTSHLFFEVGWLWLSIHVDRTGVDFPI